MLGTIYTDKNNCTILLLSLSFEIFTGTWVQGIWNEGELEVLKVVALVPHLVYTRDELLVNAYTLEEYSKL